MDLWGRGPARQATLLDTVLAGRKGRRSKKNSFLTQVDPYRGVETQAKGHRAEPADFAGDLSSPEPCPRPRDKGEKRDCVLRQVLSCKGWAPKSKARQRGGPNGVSASDDITQQSALGCRGQPGHESGLSLEGMKTT